MLYREIVAVFSELHTERINTLCGQNVELLNVKPGSTYSNNRAVKCGPVFKNLTEQCLLLWCCHITQGHYSMWLYKHSYRHSRTALPVAQRWTQSLAQYSLHIFLFAPQLRKDAQVYPALRLHIMLVFAGGCRSSRGPAVSRYFGRDAAVRSVREYRRTHTDCPDNPQHDAQRQSVAPYNKLTITTCRQNRKVRSISIPWRMSRIYSQYETSIHTSQRTPTIRQTPSVNADQGNNGYLVWQEQEGLPQSLWAQCRYI